MADTVEFRCPRCGSTVREELYGPCRTCVEQLRATQKLDTKSDALGDYVPKMNVVPNAVATKD